MVSTLNKETTCTDYISVVMVSIGMVMKVEGWEVATGGKIKLDNHKPRNDHNLTTYGVLQVVSIHPSYPEQRINVGWTLASGARAQLIEHHRQSLDVFS